MISQEKSATESSRFFSDLIVLYKKEISKLLCIINAKQQDVNVIGKREVKKMIIILAIYMIAGYWAAGKTIYANKIRIGTMTTLFMQRLIMGTLLGVVLIPWALLKK